MDFSAEAVCVAPSVALQDSNLLCFHRKDVEPAVCALAVDTYGEVTAANEDEKGNNNNNGYHVVGNNTNNSIMHTNNNKDDNSNNEADWLSSSSFAPQRQMNQFELSSASTSASLFSSTSQSMTQPISTDVNTPKTDNEREEEKEKEEKNPSTMISTTSAVVRGDRVWKSVGSEVNDGESVSLCCGRCCSPLGYVSLGSIDTWRFWKHRLFVQKTKKNKNKNKKSYRAVRYFHPFGSCTSFLARELIRYAESKAIFTFVIQCDDTNSHSNKQDICLLLRLLSWESAMATSYKKEEEEEEKQQKQSLSSSCSSSQDGSDNNNHSSRRRNIQHRRHRQQLDFKRVAKIVFEETKDPTRTNKNGHSTTASSSNNNSSSAPTQWFWGGVDLCCPPSSSKQKRADHTGNTLNSNDAAEQQQSGASTVKLQLPQYEYDQVVSDLYAGSQSYFTKAMADATILIKMGGLTDGLRLTAVAI